MWRVGLWRACTSESGKLAKYTSFVVTGPTIFGKANALAPVRTEKVCCDCFLDLFAKFVCAFLASKNLPMSFCPASTVILLARPWKLPQLRLKPFPKWVCLKRRISQVIAVQWGKRLSKSTEFGCFEVETTPIVKVRKVAVASSIDIDCTSENDQFCGIQTQMF